MRHNTKAWCAQLHERSEALRTQIGTLEGLCAGYNGVQRTMLPIEQPLLQSTLSAVDAELQSGLLVCSGYSCCCLYAIRALVWHTSTCEHEVGWGLTRWQYR